ncbi:MAG: AgmX/PglI C-terminal domain-containing protein [Proteobacteria bacterium]|nr:AgmX/PglI C-terminal domain-containing protein [Pseudomonadota bacterium]
MQDSIPPLKSSQGNKGVILLLVTGIVILAAAGVILYNRKSESQKPAPEPPPKVAEKLDVPTPLVMAQPTRPIIKEQPDTEADDSQAGSNKKTKRGRRRSEKVGSINPREVNSFMNARFGQVKTCYERRLKLNSFLEGKLDLNIDVASSGKVTQVSVNKDTLRDPGTLACVKRTIKSWKFPKPTGGRVIIGKTFNFKKKSR